MNIFFPTYGGGHVNAIIPIVNALRNRHVGISVEVLALSNSFVNLKNERVFYNSISDYKYLYSAEELLEIEKIGLEFALNHFESPNNDTVFYYGVSISELVRNVGEEQALKLFQESGRKTFEPLDFSRRLLTSIKPDKVFVTCGQRMELAMAKVANELGIEVIRLVDLVIKNLHIPYKCTLCVTNELASKYLSESNRHIKNIYVTGNPNFEYKGISNLLESKSDIVAIFTQPGDFGIEKVLRDFYKLAAKMSNFTFILKPHPSESFNKYKLLMNGAPANFSVSPSESSKDIISSASCVFTFFSSVGMEAIMQDKVLLVLNYLGTKYPVDYVKMGCAKLITDFSSLEYTMKTIEKGTFEAFHSRGYSLVQQPQNCIELILSVILKK